MQNREEAPQVQSIYEYIKAHMENGVLPEGFTLWPEQKEGNMRFADGALDGITMYHMMGAELTESDRECMGKIIRLISEGNTEQADLLLAEFAEEHRALTVIDEFEHAIRAGQADLNAANLYRYGVHLITTSANRECVKYGMEILELFTLKNEEVKACIRTLGLSDEFTLFAVFIMLQWQNANEEIFGLARKVRGWGRIHAIEKLEPQTEEIKEWLLTEGIHNTVLPDYSALTCYEKAEAEKRLQGPLSLQELQSIGKVLKAMLVEGPVPGISAVENREEVLKRYLAHAKIHHLTDADTEIVVQITEYCNKKGIETD